VLKIIFAWENKGNGPIKSFFTPRTLKKSEYKNHKVWFPKLDSKDNRFNNKWNKDKGIFSEKNDNPNKKKRIIFAGLNDGEKYEFLGIFEYDEKRDFWRRNSIEFPIIRFSI